MILKKRRHTIQFPQHRHRHTAHSTSTHNNKKNRKKNNALTGVVTTPPQHVIVDVLFRNAHIVSTDLAHHRYVAVLRERERERERVEERKRK